MSLHETINSFIRSLEEEISQNSQQVQRLMEQQSSSNLPKSTVGQVETLIVKEQQNASKLQILEEISIEATEIVEEQHHRLEEARLNLTTTLTEVEASEAEIYGGARPNVKSRAQVTSVTPTVFPEETIARQYDSHCRAKPEQWLEDHAVLLRDEVFSVVPGTVNMQCDTALKNRKVRSDSNYSEDEVFQLPQVPDTPIAGSSHEQKGTFRSLVVRPGSVSSTPHFILQPVSFDVSQIPDSETSGKDTESEAEVRPRTPHAKIKRMREDASMASHSLQLLAEEFRKICKPKIQRKLTNMEAVQLVKDYTSEGARGVVEFHLDMNSTWKYHELIEHHKASFESGETFSSLVGDFYSHVQ